MTTMRAYAFRASKFGTLLTLLFAIPMFVEVDELLALWLKTPPQFANGLCLCWLVVVVLEKLSLGHIAAVFATGRVAKFCFFRGLMCLTAIPFSVAAVTLSGSVYSIGLALVLTTILAGASDIILARSRAGLGYRCFLMQILIPLLILTIVCTLVGFMPQLVMPQSFFRIVLSTLLVLGIFLPLSWFLVMDNTERVYVRSKVAAKFPFRRGI